MATAEAGDRLLPLQDQPTAPRQRASGRTHRQTADPRTTVDLSKRGMDDDDFVFLEAWEGGFAELCKRGIATSGGQEWLRRYDCANYSAYMSFAEVQ